MDHFHATVVANGAMTTLDRLWIDRRRHDSTPGLVDPVIRP